MKTLIAFVVLAFAGSSVLSAEISSNPGAVAAEGKVNARAPGEVVDIVIHFAAADGTPLEAKLSVPAGAKNRVPVLYHLHGAGPRNFDNPVGQYKDAEGQIRIRRYYDFYAHEVARRGLGFFRMSKRGCTVEPSGRPLVDQSVFSKATPTVLLNDYVSGLEVLRERKEIDPSRIVLSGASEGTRLAPQLALRSPDGIVGMVLAGYVNDNQLDIVRWQNTAGPWRNIQKIIPAAADGTLTRQEYDTAVSEDASLAAKLPFAAIDPDADGTVTEADIARLVRPRLDAIIKAVEEGNDEFLGKALLGLNSAYLRDGWDGEPNHLTLLKLDIPVDIFHGELDGTTRVEGVREAEAAFRKAGKTNLTVHIYPGHDHDLNWTLKTSANGGPKPFQDAFNYVAELVRRP